MSIIRTLFELDVNRQIEPVVNYATNAQQEELLLIEVNEYVATDLIEERIDKLLDAIEDGASGRPNTEIGIWVSGFYGSGKSSFTKYMGMALDADRQLGGKPFRERLGDRLNPTLRQRLLTIATRYPAAVVMLDLASESTGAMQLVHQELYRKVLQWAGFSNEPRTRDLELRLLRDGKLDEFRTKAQEIAGVTWEELRNDPYFGIQVASQLAHSFYPKEFRTEDSLANTAELKIERGMDEEIRTMLSLVRQKTKRETVIFVIDEVGQYVAPVDDRITRLQGLAEELKRHGNAFLLATAQQTLTNDHPDAALNSAKLNKLRARFPVGLELKASDISTIITERLLKKSAAGTASLRALYDRTGNSLIHATRLRDVSKAISLTDLNQDDFVKLYPFLPQHFELMLRLLSSLATKHGGMGLRSALKLTQDMLLDRSTGTSVADGALGRLITLADFYQVLTLEIGRTMNYLKTAVDRVKSVCGATSLEAEAAAAVAVLQIIEGVVPSTVENIAALLQPDATASRTIAEIKSALDTLVDSEHLPFALINDQVQVLSDEVKELETLRNTYQPTNMDRLKLEELVLKELLSENVRRITLGGNRGVTAGFRWQKNDVLVPVVTGADPIQIVVSMIDDEDYAAQVHALATRSTDPQEQNQLYAAGILPVGWDDQIRELFRSNEVVKLHQHTARSNDEAQYIRSQEDMARRLVASLVTKARKSLESGSFLFRGQNIATRTEAPSFVSALQKRLKEVAESVYDKYRLVGQPVGADVAVLFLQIQDLSSLTPDKDPLALADSSGGVRQDHAALLAVADHLRSRNQVDGKPLLEHFANPPYGWSKDTTRYLVAALLRDGRIKLRTNGQDVSGSSTEARAAIGNTAGFNKITLRLAEGVPSPQLRNKAAHRLEELTTESVSPTINGIGRAARDYFPQRRTQLASLPSRLQALQVPGEERANQLLRQLDELLAGDDAEVISRLGDPENALVTDLRWAENLQSKLSQGLEGTLRELAPMRQRLTTLPEVNALEELRRAAEEPLTKLSDLLAHDTFGGRVPDITANHRQLQEALQVGVTALAQTQQARLREVEEQLQNMPTWQWVELAQQENIAAVFEKLQQPYQATYKGTVGELDALLTHWYPVEERLSNLRQQVASAQAPISTVEIGADDIPGNTEPMSAPAAVRLRRKLHSAGELDLLIARLQQLRTQWIDGQQVELDFEE